MNFLWALIHPGQLTLGSVPAPSCPLLLEFPTLATKSVQLSGKQLLSCCSFQMEISFRWPCYHDQQTVAAVTWAAEHFQRKHKNLRERFEEGKQAWDPVYLFPDKPYLKIMWSAASDLFEVPITELSRGKTLWRSDVCPQPIRLSLLGGRTH